MENNVAIVQPTPHLKNKDLNVRKNVQKPAQSPTRGTNTESESFYLIYYLYKYADIIIFQTNSILYVAMILMTLLIVPPIINLLLFSSVVTHLSQKKVREVPPYREPPGLASPPGLRTLPPYRDPPPPNLNSPGRSQFVPDNGSPHVHKDDQPSSSNSMKLKRNLIQVSLLLLLYLVYNFVATIMIYKYRYNNI